ncbi:hypothetical protein H2198_002866 [Neophaeococcomyces mojaviensis]|uniref:Uncharacterized protein n=1 Tax=Neophaeococcomyces mojaviensis TaxID=3383035 RepID=A0ACC3AD25_9EURO|nr:hypothetical protein H2198_002866 [Knufia sp. JES_112]
MGDFAESGYVEVKDLYQAVTGQLSWDARWSEYKDPGEENRKLQPYRAEFPILHKWKCTNVYQGTWVTSSIEINDKALRTRIEQILADVPNLDFDVDILSFEPPFKPFLLKWESLTAALELEPQGRLRNLLQHVYDIVSPAVLPILEKINKARASQTIDWELLKSSCVPGELIYGKFFREPQAYKIVKFGTWWEDNIECMKLDVDYHDWDGHKAGFRRTQFVIKQFEAEIPLNDLKIVPFKFLKREQQVREQLIERAKSFEKLLGYHFKHYSGNKLTKLPTGCMKMGQITARVIVDAYAYHKFFEEEWLEDEKKSEPNSEDEISEVETEAQKQTDTGRREVIQPFTEEQYLLSIPTVKGFDIENREWCQFFLGGFTKIAFNDKAYEKLVLDEGEKKMILAFSEQIRDSGIGFDDFIRNKGRGILMLLCGPPGVGKTLTAESVAERAHLPLYAVNAGEIGHETEKADGALKTVLECCRLWNAVLLLDEADVFLEARGADSLTRNELVSVFLRRLEYFGGLMFLTTNRPRNIDPAFESRLDLIIAYPDLDAKARRIVWNTFITHELGNTIKETDYDSLAKYKCNGREIKNIVKIGRMLANQEKTKLSMEHISTVLRLRIKAAKVLGTGQFE